MPNHHRTPVLEVRALVAAGVRRGDLLACHTDRGTYPVRVLDVDTSPDDHVLITLEEVGHAAGLPTPLIVACPPDLNLKPLPQHYGVCHQCGRLAPCPDELEERNLEKLWTHPPTSTPPPEAPDLP